MVKHVRYHILIQPEICEKSVQQNMYGNHWEKIGQHFPSISYILHLTYFNSSNKNHLLYKQTSDKFL